MKKLMVNIAILAACTSIMTGCASNTQTQNTGIGAVSGAVIGGVGAGLLGGNPVAIGITAVAGALIGGYIGHNMDSTDATTVNSTMSNNETNIPQTWTNSKTGITYKIVPTSGMIMVNGNPNCRTFNSSAVYHGKKHYNHGVACRQSDGSWTLTKK